MDDAKIMLLSWSPKNVDHQTRGLGTCRVVEVSVHLIEIQFSYYRNSWHKMSILFPHVEIKANALLWFWTYFCDVAILLL